MWRCKLCGGLIGFQNAMTHEGYSVIHSVVCLDCGNSSMVDVKEIANWVEKEDEWT